MDEMKKYKFTLALGTAVGKEIEIVELPADYTESEVEGEFREWVWNQLDAWYEEVKNQVAPRPHFAVEQKYEGVKIMEFTKEKAIELIEQEIEFAKGTGMPQFVLGLQQAKKVIELEFEREK